MPSCNFRQTDLSDFLDWLAEILQLCFTSDASALMVALLAFSKLCVQTLMLNQVCKHCQQATTNKEILSEIQRMTLVQMSLFEIHKGSICSWSPFGNGVLQETWWLVTGLSCNPPSLMVTPGRIVQKGLCTYWIHQP